eukprot:TRINITY_DN3005_c0_g1_i1.p1 TRINITY_DN3005_c0_g1~~TRINITY_DN3005_c0_g1_i1.p1  ORF type:complete len:479 (+),score=126.48 TRINITY_DN3005_c0_g1_i1:114-1439(+)
MPVVKDNSKVNEVIQIDPLLKDEKTEIKLCFSAYFLENVYESPDCNVCVHHCIINYFLNDGTISILEPRIENSGFTQGMYLKRCKVERHKAGSNEGFINSSDLRVGQVVRIFEREFYIFAVDEFTRNEMEKRGVELKPNETPLEDGYLVHRQARRLNETQKTHNTGDRNSIPLRKFLDHYNKVLRFYCVWDTRDEAYGDFRLFSVHYFLEDDTVEILEKLSPFGGRIGSNLFYRRNNLNINDRPVNEDDFKVGEEVIIGDRHFLVYDADPFTRKYFYEKGKPLAEGFTVEEPELKISEPEIPPYTGFGSEEDSLSSLRSLMPKPPKVDLVKFLQNDGKVLRFKAKMLNDFESDRTFILSYFLADDTMSIYEPHVRNSGMAAGKFLERGKVKKLDGNYFHPIDFNVGEQIDIHSHSFLIIDVDNFAKHWYKEQLGIELNSSL